MFENPYRSVIVSILVLLIVTHAMSVILKYFTFPTIQSLEYTDEVDSLIFPALSICGTFQVAGIKNPKIEDFLKLSIDILQLFMSIKTKIVVSWPMKNK